MKTNLPIDVIRNEFLAHMQGKPVIVSSPTGSGKSTQIPRWCRALGRVLVVEPRRVACRSLAVRVAQLEGCQLGKEIGYCVRDDRRADEHTQVVFATPGIVLRWLAKDALPSFSTVVVDELHERSLDVDLIVALLRARYEGQICLMSATIDGDRLASTLSGQHLSAPGRLYPVEQHYRPQGAQLPSIKGLEGRVVGAVKEARQQEGDMLVFLPGKAEISAVYQALRPHTSDLELLTLHGGLTLKEQGRVFAPATKRRIILSTNVAETSLTIPNIGVVIDSGLVRQTRYFSGRGFLMLVPVANDSADQRAGRAGRTRAGVCFRLWSPTARLQPQTPPEIFRESLVPLVLASEACGARVEDLPFLDSPREYALAAAREELEALGAVALAGGITERGRKLFGLPLDSHHGRLLIEAEGSPYFEDVIDLIAVLSVGRPLFLDSRRDKDNEEADEEGNLRAQGSDVVALVRALREGEPQRHGLRRSILDEARAVSRRLRAAYKQPRRSAQNGPVDAEAIARIALAADPRCAHVRRVRKRHVAWSNGGTEMILSRGSAVRSDDVEAIVVLDTHAIGQGERDTQLLITCATPLKRRWMVEAGLGRDRLDRVRLEKGRVQSLIERIYAGHCLERREETPTGVLAREAVSTLFLRGSLFGKTYQTTVNRLESAALFLQLLGRGLARQTDTWKADPIWGAMDPIGSPEDWTLATLDALGVESGDDVALLSPEDLIPAPLPAAVQTWLDRTYPRVVSLTEEEYRVEYDLKKRWVTLHRTRGQRKALPPLSYLPAFSGFGLRVEQRGKVRELRRRP